MLIDALKHLTRTSLVVLLAALGASMVTGSVLLATETSFSWPKMIGLFALGIGGAVLLADAATSLFKALRP